MALRMPVSGFRLPAILASESEALIQFIFFQPFRLLRKLLMHYLMMRLFDQLQKAIEISSNTVIPTILVSNLD